MRLFCNPNTLGILQNPGVHKIYTKNSCSISNKNITDLKE